MKVLMINGSPRINGNTKIALNEMKKIFDEEKIESEIVEVGSLSLSGCLSCGFCYKNGRCVKDDIVNEVAKKFEKADGLVIGSPVYYAGANGVLLAFLQRLFYSTNFDKTMKVGASVVALRRGGASATFDILNKFFTISSMPVVSSQYWNSVHGAKAGEANEDLEGLQTMRTLARNMSFLMKAIASYKENYPDSFPEKEKRISTNFIIHLDD